MTGSTVEQIISDDEVTRVHGHANFGSMTPRQVIADGVLKYAYGYSSGHTQLCILMEHKLIHKPKPGSYQSTLTKKGRTYLRAAWPIADTRAQPLLNLAAFRAGMLAAAGLAESSREAVIYSGERRYVEGVGQGHVRAANAIRAIANDPDKLAALMKGGGRG